MKKLLSMISCVLILATCAMSAQAQTAVCDECYDFTVLTGVETNSRMLSASTQYLIEDCYVIPNGVTLTIPAGTQLFGDAVSKGMLIVERGGTLIANGTSNNPIVFTSCRPVDEREAGDWGGIAIFGKATNNVSGGEITLSRCGNSYTGGHATTFVDNDNSGSLQYVQIHYAGGGNTGDQEVNGLTLVSVGHGTTLEHIQVTSSYTNGIKYIGGTVNSKYLAGYNNRQTDFWYTQGYNGMGQFLMSLRTDPAVYDNVNPQFSNGILAENNDIGPGYTGSPLTNPILSNVSIFGPKYCDEEVNTDAATGITLRGNTTAWVQNSFISGYQTGLFVQHEPTIVNVNNDLVGINYSSFFNNNPDQFSSAPSMFDQTGTFCVSDINEWVIDVNGFGCEQVDNAIMPLAPGYHSSICNETYCGNENRPSFVLTTNDLGDTSFAGVDFSNLFFTKTGVNYRGAFGSTDWTVDWTNWCAQETDYCPELQQRKSGSNTNSRLHIAPNPASGISYALFDAMQTGKVQVSVRDKVSGQVLRSSSSLLSDAGSQRVAIPVDGLQAGVYIVQVMLPNGSVLSGQLFVL